MHLTFGALALMTVFALWLAFPMLGCLIEWLLDLPDRFR